MGETKGTGIYKYKNRVIVRTFLALFTVAMIVFGSLSVYVLGMVGTDEIFSTGSAESTASYQNLVNDEVQMLRSSLDARKPFETNGELDINKTIDIMNPRETDVNKQNKNTTFLVKDLIAMNSSGVFNGVESIGNYAIVPQGQEGTYYGFEAEGAYEYGDAQNVAPGAGRQIGEILDRMSNLRLAMPVSGKSLMEYARENNDGINALAIFEALYDMKGMMYDYDEYGPKSSAVGTNLRYYIKDVTDAQVITNGGWKSLAEAEEAAKKGGTLLRYNRNTQGLVFDAVSSENFYMAKQVLMQRPLMGQVEDVVIGVDKDYPAKDTLSEFAYGYNRLKPYFMPFLIVAILSLIGTIVCFILATVTTGQNEKRGEVALNIFDRIPTEIGAGIVIFAGIIDIAISIWIYESLSYGYGNNVLKILCVLGMFLTVILMATWGYLSLVRRIKTKDLWRNSLCCRIFDVLKKVYYAGKMSVRLVISFVAFVVANILMTVVLGIIGLIIVLIADTLILVYLLKEATERQKVKEGLETIAAGNLDYKLDTTDLRQDNKEMAESANRIADGMQSAVEKSMKNERMRSELITNVSHDIKTPLTSIINYVDLLKREDIKNPQVKGYIDILDAKSQRLKHLTEDLVEASKVSSGNIELHMDNLYVQELLQQAEGEFDEKLKARSLEVVSTFAAEPVIIKADGRQMWRIFENLLNNISKYALEGTRVYVDLTKEGKKATLMFKNMSQEALNINADELTERFVRGDISRTTEGSGLGLSIAKSLTEMQGGKFEIYLDGDLFKVTLTFDTV